MFKTFVYDSAISALANGEINFATANLKIMLVNYNYNNYSNVQPTDTEYYIPDSFKKEHIYRANVSYYEVSAGSGYSVGGKTISYSTTKSLSNDYVDVVFSDVQWDNLTTYSIYGAVIYVDTGDENTDNLLVFCDMNTSSWWGINPVNQTFSIKFQRGIRFQN